MSINVKLHDNKCEIISKILYYILFFWQFRPSSGFDTTYTTTNAGAPVWNDNEALTVGSRGNFNNFS